MYIILFLVIILLLYSINNFNNEYFNNEYFIDTGGCHDCYMRNIAGNLVVKKCSKPWQSNNDYNCNCLTCYEPQYYNNDVPFQYENEQLIKFGDKVCQCDSCTNSQITPRAY
jgi:hypothetical protein